MCAHTLNDDIVVSAQPSSVLSPLQSLRVMCTLRQLHALRCTDTDAQREPLKLSDVVVLFSSSSLVESSLANVGVIVNV